MLPQKAAVYVVKRQPGSTLAFGTEPETREIRDTNRKRVKERTCPCTLMNVVIGWGWQTDLNRQHLLLMTKGSDMALCYTLSSL